MRRLSGSVDDFRRFVESTSPGFLRAAYALLGDHAAAEDATQLALLRTYRHWDQALDSPGGYTWRVLVNVCRNERRRRGRSLETGVAELGDPPSTEVLDSAVAARHDLEGALQRLSYSQREAVVLRYFLELSVSETAHVLGVPEGTVKSMTARALTHLRRDLSITRVEVHDVTR